MTDGYKPHVYFSLLITADELINEGGDYERVGRRLKNILNDLARGPENDDTKRLRYKHALDVLEDFDLSKAIKNDYQAIATAIGNTVVGMLNPTYPVIGR